VYFLKIIGILKHYQVNLNQLIACLELHYNF